MQHLGPIKYQTIFLEKGKNRLAMTKVHKKEND